MGPSYRDTGIAYGDHGTWRVSDGPIQPMWTRGTLSKVPADPDELLTDDEHRELNDDLARMAETRRRAEVESRGDRMA